MEQPSGVDPGDAVIKFIGRLFLGAIGWAVGSVVLVGIFFISAAPYGGGTVVPLFLVIPWTAIVVGWAIQPLYLLKTMNTFVPMAVLFVALFGGITGSVYWYLGSGDRERKSVADDFAIQFEPHSSYFSRICQTSGTRVFKEKIGVTGIVVQGIRAKPSKADLQDQKFVGDVYSQFDTSWDPERSFVSTFLTKTEWEARWHTPSADEMSRYPLIEMATIQDGISGFNRYTDVSKGSAQKFAVSFSEIATSAYLVRIEDISTPEDRLHWIAGSKWTIVEISTGEILGESVSYAMDFHQGQTVFSGGFGNAGEPWDPWLRAGHVQYRKPNLKNACPEKDTSQQRVNNLDFVRAVLIPVWQQVKIIPAN